MENRKCLNDKVLTSYLEGSLSEGERSDAEAHLVACDRCRGQLVDFMRLLDEEVQEEEDAILSRAMDQWVPAGTVGHRRSRQVRWWLTGAAAALIAVSVGLFYYGTEPSVPGYDEAVVLAVLSQPTRSLEARLSLFDSPESYRPFIALRGVPDAAAADRVSELSPGGPEVGSHARGVFFLARREFDQAVELLEQAVIEEDTPAARNDLGVAYMEQTWTSAEERNAYRELAAMQFEIALRLDARFAPAQFNLALWYERASLMDEFRAEAAAYLRLDPSSGWADEIRALGG